MIGIAFAVVAVFVVMVFMGASVLESEHIKRHPPDGDGCREDGKRDE